MSKDRSPQSTPSARPERIHAFDAIRSVAIVLVILLHAGVPYIRHRMPGLLWPTFDESSLLIDGLFWWIECFIMAFYFLTAGYFAAQIYYSKGLRNFFKNRMKRLFGPLVAASIFVLPTTGFIWTLGWVLEGKYPAQKLRSFRFEAAVEKDFFGFSHLWFLEYLFIFCLGFALLKLVQSYFSKRTAQPVTIDEASWKWIVPLLIGTPICAVMLWLDPRVVIGFQQSQLPLLYRSVYYVLFFSAGMWFYLYRGWIPFVTKYSIALAVCSVILFAGMLPSILTHLENETAASQPWLSVAVPIFAWLTILGFSGLAFRYVSGENRMLRYIADASFWMYLIHLPVVGLAHLVLLQLPVIPEVKLLLTMILSLGFTLGSYQLCIRHTWVGTWLDGKSIPKKRSIEVRDSASGDEQFISPAR